MTYHPFDKEHNFHIHEPHAHQIHHADFNSFGDDDNTFLSDWLVEAAVFVINLFS